MIASVHIGVALPAVNRTKRYHSIARAIRTCLHAYGIHSSTIQPEFTDEINPPQTTLVEEEEDTPLLEVAGGGNCLFQCVGGGECVDGRCCAASNSGTSGDAGRE